MYYKTFDTDRLHLRPCRESDAPFVLQLLNSPKWLEHIGDRNVHTEDDARNYICERMLPHLERLGFGNYVVVRKDDGTTVGTCSLYQREGLDGVDIGYALLPQHEGQGYIIEAAHRLMEAAFDDFCFTALYGITTHTNLASQRVLEKLGMQWIENIRMPDDPEELRLYKVVPGSTF